MGDVASSFCCVGRLRFFCFGCKGSLVRFCVDSGYVFYMFEYFGFV